MNTLSIIQQEVKAPKGQFNSFGKYKYRSCEDIVEAVKPIINSKGFHLTLSDEVLEVGGRIYVKATATLCNGEETYSTTAYAREDDIKKGMDSAQITGAASSYARKYALNGLFAIDDTKDADSTNNHASEVTADQKKRLEELLWSSSYDEEMKKKMYLHLNNIHTQEHYERAEAKLLSSQMDDSTRIANGKNYNQNDIKKTLKAHV